MKLFGFLFASVVVISVTRAFLLRWQCWLLGHQIALTLVPVNLMLNPFIWSAISKWILKRSRHLSFSGQWEIIIFIMKLALWLMLACLFTNEADIIWLKINSFRVTLIIKRGNHSIKYNIPVTLTCQVGEKLVLN